MNRTKDEWAKVRPAAFAGGSMQQAINVIEMMQQDIAELHQQLGEERDKGMNDTERRQPS